VNGSSVLEDREFLGVEAVGHVVLGAIHPMVNRSVMPARYRARLCRRRHLALCPSWHGNREGHRNGETANQIFHTPYPFSGIKAATTRRQKSTIGGAMAGASASPSDHGAAIGSRYHL
jgi:hypothetical protein